MIKTFTITPVRKTLVVNATQAHAFDVFTNRLDSWWPKGHSIGALPVKQSFIEPRKGGRWYTTHDDGSECVVGHMKVWEPPHRIVFSWEISADWKPDPSVASEVEITFVAQDARTTHHAHRARTPEFRGSWRGGWREDARRRRGRLVEPAGDFQETSRRLTRTGEGRPCGASHTQSQDF